MQTHSNLRFHLFLDKVGKIGGELFQLHRPLVAFALHADGNRTVGLLLFAHDEQERNPLQLVVAYFSANLFVAAVYLGTNIGIIRNFKTLCA